MKDGGKLNNHPKKIIFFLPNIFTALNMACGFASIIWAIQGNFFESAGVLVLGVIFDSVDGRVARLTETQSSFGEQFDSMSDMISFGMAPAILMYQKYLYKYERLGIAVAFVYVLFAALRLARFNASINKISHSYFQGLPSPGAALAIVGYIFLVEKYAFLEGADFIPMIYTFSYGILMILNIPFSSFKDINWARKHKKSALFFFFILATLTFIYYKIMFALGMFMHVLVSFIIYLKKKQDLSNIFQWQEDDEN